MTLKINSNFFTAHCTIDETISSLVVVVGTDSSSVENDGTIYEISKIINHESYDV